MTTPDPFVHDDAAYVLGALSDTERAAFEAHLTTCEDCAARVRELADLPDLLAGIPADVLAASEDVPDTLLPGLLRKAAGERRRRAWLVTGLAGVAAACLIALVVAVWPANSSGPTPRTQAMAAVSASPVHATARLVSKQWGTEIDLKCRYDIAYASGVQYWLVVYDKQGTAHDAGSWTLVPGKVTAFTGGTSVPTGQISRVDITAGSQPILRLNV